MKRTAVSIALLFGLVFGLPRPAFAQWGFFEWLAGLDPGPFSSGHIGFTGACFFNQSTGSSLEVGRVASDPAVKQFICHEPDRHLIRFNVDVSVGLGKSHVPPHEDQTLLATMLSGAFEVNYKGIRPSVGVGALWISGVPDTSAARHATIRYGVTVAPIIAVRSFRNEPTKTATSAWSAMLQNFEVKFDLYTFTSPFTAEQFGGTTAQTPFKQHEVIPVVTLQFGFMQIGHFRF